MTIAAPLGRFRLVSCWHRINYSILAFILMALIGVAIFLLTHDSLVVSLALVVPVILFAWISSWWAGALVGGTAALLVAPYRETSLVAPTLDLYIWIYLAGCYLLLGILVGLQGARVRESQQQIMAEAENKLKHAQASSKRYEALLMEMSEGQELLNRMNNELALLNTIATTVNSTLDLHQVQATAMANISVLLDVDEICFFWLDAEEHQFALQCSHPRLSRDEIVQPVPVDEGIMGHALQQREVIVIVNEADLALRPPSMSTKIRSIIAVPLRSRGRIAGMLVLGRHSGQAFTQDDGKFLESVGRVLAVAVENASLFKEAQDLSLTDELTGLANRRLLNLRLSGEVSRVTATGDPLCLAVLDLDYFKMVNDRYGHPAGDEVLRQFAKRVQREVRSTDLFCRLGGEEFALVAINTPFQITLAIVERICRHIAQIPFELPDGSLVPLTVSAGVAYLQPGVASGDELIAAADRALYAAKTSGRNRVMVYSPALAAQAAS